MSKPIRILSLDGGGVRGISTLYILKRIMGAIRAKLPGPDSKPMPKPSQYFDLIGGTSTGGIIAIMLGRLDMNVSDCLIAYRDLAEIAFVPKNKNVLKRLPLVSKIPDPEGEFSAEALENAIQFILQKFCGEESGASSATKPSSQAAIEKFKDASCCRTAVLAITKDNVNAAPTIFKTYEAEDEFEDCTISEIARATSAATTFFPSIKVGRMGMEFIDAGLGYNNPSERLEQEAREIFKDATEFYIVSIGTGIDGVLEITGRRSIVRALTKLATASERVHSRMDARHEESNYSRFNVINGLHDVTLSDWEESSRIAAHTHNYVETAAVKRQITKCAERLMQLDHASSPGSSDQFPRHQIPDSISSRSSQGVFMIPLDTNKNYVPRPKLEKDLCHIFQPNSASHAQTRAALHGLGGSGKTQIAVRYAQNYRSCYIEIFWVNGINEESFMDGFCSIAKVLGIGSGEGRQGTVDATIDWLTKHKTWLLIVDNVDDENSLNLLHTKFLKAGYRGHVLVTSRYGAVRHQFEAIEVGDMIESEAITLLKNIAGETAIEDAASGELLNCLGFLPLAVDQAASYIRFCESSVTDYLEHFQQDKSSYLAKNPSTQYNTNKQGTVMNTWNVSFTKIKNEYPDAANLLLMLSLLEADDVSLLILESCQQGQYDWAPDGSFRKVEAVDEWIPRDIIGALLRKASFIEAKAVLLQFAFIRKGAEETKVYIHPLVRHWAAQELSKHPDLEKKLMWCLIGLVTSCFEKQDRFAPILPRTHGFRGFEEARLGVWPWRRYPLLAGPARQCLRLAHKLDPVPSLARLSLPLLQVLEYSTFGSFEHDQSFSLKFIESFDSQQHDYTGWALAIWRLQRSDLCICHKQTDTFLKAPYPSGKWEWKWALRQDVKLENWDTNKEWPPWRNLQLCNSCRMTFKLILEKLRSLPACARCIAAYEFLLFRLESNYCWLWYLSLMPLLGEELSIPDNIFRSITAGMIWEKFNETKRLWCKSRGPLEIDVEELTRRRLRLDDEASNVYHQHAHGKDNTESDINARIYKMTVLIDRLIKQQKRLEQYQRRVESNPEGCDVDGPASVTRWTLATVKWYLPQIMRFFILHCEELWRESRVLDMLIHDLQDSNQLDDRQLSIVMSQITDLSLGGGEERTAQSEHQSNINPRKVSFFRQLQYLISTLREGTVMDSLWPVQPQTIDRIAQDSWIQEYGLCLELYLQMRSAGEQGWSKSELDRTGDDIWDTMKRLCGEDSEECRRAAFYSCIAVPKPRIAQIIQRLEPQVKLSIAKPVQDWAHERCIIEYVGALISEKQSTTAQDCLRHIHKAYEECGLKLLTVEQSLKQMERQRFDQTQEQVGLRKPIQVFMKTLSGKTITLNTTSMATVSDLHELAYEIEGTPQSEARLIFGGKTLEKKRMLSDYNIQDKSTVDLVFRLSGGNRCT